MRMFIATILLLTHFSNCIRQEQQSFAPKQVLYKYVKIFLIVSSCLKSVWCFQKFPLQRKF